MKRILFVVLACTVIVSGATAAHAVGPIRHRQQDQAARIHHGVQSGALTPGEASALRHEQRHINRDRRQALADGTLSRPEARHLTHKQNQASRHIHRLTHNPETAPAQP
jgi:hypothetical protein